MDVSPQSIRVRQFTVEETERLAAAIREVFAAVSDWANYLKAKTTIVDLMKSRGYEV